MESSLHRLRSSALTHKHEAEAGEVKGLVKSTRSVPGAHVGRHCPPIENDGTRLFMVPPKRRKTTAMPRMQPRFGAPPVSNPRLLSYTAHRDRNFWDANEFDPKLTLFFAIVTVCWWLHELCKGRGQ